MSEINIREFPITTFKYRSFGEPFHKDLLEKRQLYFPKTNQVNDPFDCKIPIQLKNFSGNQFISDTIELARIAFPGRIIDEYYQMAIVAAKMDLVNNQEHIRAERKLANEDNQRN